MKRSQKRSQKPNPSSLWSASRAALLLLATGLLTIPASQAAAPGDSRVIAVEVGVHKLIRQPEAVARVAVGDPAVAEVTVLNRREVLITGKKSGLTSLLIWPKGVATAQEFRLRVGPAVDPLKPKLVDPETAGTKSDVQDGLSGTSPNLLAHRRAKIGAEVEAQRTLGTDKPIKLADRSNVDLETQVMTEVKIVEVKRSTLQQFGLSAIKNSGNTTAGVLSPGSVSSISNGGATGTGYQFDMAPPIASAFNLIIGDPRQGLLGILSFLEGKGLARTYAEPTLTAMSGQTASFLAGGEFPVPVSQGGTTGGITIQYREFGVRLSLTPTVLSRDRIALKVAPEVSDLDFSAGITTSGVSVPALTVRRTDTTVELGDGESFVISGLVSNNLINNVSKVPWLGDLPVIGAFFKNTSVNREQKELVMVVTPRLVRPLSRDARRPALPGASTEAYKPSFAELMFLETGKFENETYGFSK
ncbi:MAG: type II and III secretion system protein family protein [Stagnimonas sp.]|nr:type II and III secretion system protein family protein [Stagnimonas sp.]